MRRWLLIGFMACSAVAQDVYVSVDKQDSSGSPLTVYKGESADLGIRFYVDGQVSNVTGRVMFWYGTNGLASDAISSMSVTVTNKSVVTIPYVATNFPAASPRIKPWIYGVNVDDAVWGDGKLSVKDNPSVADGVLSLLSRLYINWNSVTQYFGTPPVIGDGVTILNTVSGDGSYTLSTVPVVESNFLTSVAYNITSTDTSNWTTAYGWGNHAVAGYASTAALASTSTADRAYADAAVQAGTNAFKALADTLYQADNANLDGWSLISTNGTVNWSAAYLWGNHALAGYLTGESDTNALAVIAGLTNNIAQGVTAYGWGDHGVAGYLTNGDTVTNLAVRAYTNGANVGVFGILNAGTGISATLDAGAVNIFNLNVAASIISGAANGDTAAGWGNHASAGYLTSVAEFAGANSTGTVSLTGAATGKYLRDDGTWQTIAGGGDMLASTYDADTNGVADDVDAVAGVAAGTLTNQAARAFGWGDHGTNGYLTAYTETDPLWGAVSNDYFRVDGSTMWTGNEDGGGQASTNWQTVIATTGQFARLRGPDYGAYHGAVEVDGGLTGPGGGVLIVSNGIQLVTGGIDLGGNNVTNSGVAQVSSYSVASSPIALSNTLWHYLAPTGAVSLTWAHSGPLAERTVYVDMTAANTITWPTNWTSALRASGAPAGTNLVLSVWPSGTAGQWWYVGGGE